MSGCSLCSHPKSNCKQKKPTRQNTLRSSTASAYFLPSLPAWAGLLFIQSSVAIEDRASSSCIVNACTLRFQNWNVQRLFSSVQNDTVGNGSNWWRGGLFAAVETGGALWCVLLSREDQSVDFDLLDRHQETQECDLTLRFGKRFVGKY